MDGKERFNANTRRYVLIYDEVWAIDTDSQLCDAVNRLRGLGLSGATIYEGNPAKLPRKAVKGLVLSAKVSTYESAGVVVNHATGWTSGSLG